MGSETLVRQIDQPASALAVPAAAATAILVGAAIVATRAVVDQAGPATLALLRYLIGFCCLLPPLVLSLRDRRLGTTRALWFNRRDLLPIGLLGITQFGILIVLLNYSLRSIPSARAALIFATFPLLTMGLAAAIRRERLTASKVLGVLLTIAGVAFALGERAHYGSTRGAWAGELAAFASALSGAVCSVLYKPYLQKYSTLSVSAFAMLASVGFLAVLATGEGLFASSPRFTAGGWTVVAFIGLSSGVGYYLWLWALKHTTPTRVTVFLALSPITATVLGAFLLSEEVSRLFVVGLILVCAGLWSALSDRSPWGGTPSG